MDYVCINQDEIIGYRRNADRRGLYRIKKVGEEFIITHKHSGSIVKATKTAEAAEEFFYDKIQPSDVGIWSLLRCSCQIDKGVTLGDLFRIIETNEELHRLIEILYPFLNLHGNGNKKGTIPIGRNIRLIKHPFIEKQQKIIFTSKFDENTSKWDQNSELHLDLQTQIIESSKTQYSRDCLSVLEVLDCLFCGTCDDRQQIVFNKDGLSSMDGPIDDPMSYLMHPCRLSDGLTLMDVFRFVDRHELLKVFLSFYSWCKDIDDFHQLAKQPVTNSSDLFYLEISKWFQVKKDYFKYWQELTGIGKVYDPEIYGDKVPESESYGVEMTPVNELVHLPLRTKNTIEYEGEDYTTEYSLLDILDSIYDEISFLGGPEDIEKIREELIKRKDDIERSL
jgi:hypothetical protein